MSLILRMNNQWTKVLDPRPINMYLYTSSGITIDVHMSEDPAVTRNPQIFPLGGTVEIIRSDPKYYTFARATSKQIEADNYIPMPHESLLLISDDPISFGDGVKAELRVISEQLMNLTVRVSDTEIKTINQRLDYDWFVRNMLNAIRRVQTNMASNFTHMLKINQKVFAAERLVIEQREVNKQLQAWLTRLENSSKFHEIDSMLKKHESEITGLRTNVNDHYADMQGRFSYLYGQYHTQLSSIFQKLLLDNNRIFDLERKAAKQVSTNAFVHEKVTAPKVTELTVRKLAIQLANISASVVGLQSRLDDTVQAYNNDGIVTRTELMTINNEFSYLNNALNKLAAATSDVELDETLQKLVLGCQEKSIIPTLNSIKRLIHDLNRATSTNELHADILSTKLDIRDKIEIGATSLSNIADMIADPTPIVPKPETPPAEESPETPAEPEVPEEEKNTETVE